MSGLNAKRIVIIKLLFTLSVNFRWFRHSLLLPANLQNPISATNTSDIFYKSPFANLWKMKTMILNTKSEMTGTLSQEIANLNVSSFFFILSVYLKRDMQWSYLNGTIVFMRTLLTIHKSFFYCVILHMGMNAENC